MQCQEGYKLENGNCVRLKNCIESKNNICLKCENNYILQNGECVPCGEIINKCVTSSDNICTGCETDYYLTSENTCKMCVIDNCDECTRDGSCRICSFNYTKTIGSMECMTCSKMEGCSYCVREEEMKCQQVQPKYYIDNQGRSKKCTQLDANCDECTVKGCTKCKEGYTNVNGNCEKCGEAINGCSTCSTINNVCYECSNDRYLSLGRCLTFNELIPMCSNVTTEENEIVCKECIDGYYTEEDKCVKCDIIDNCIECNNRTTCTKCTKGYKVSSSGQCEKECEIKNCKVYKEGVNCKCNKCQEGYTLQNETTCSLCSEIFTDCSLCSQTENKCLSCKSDQYYLEDNKCNLCSSKLSNCFKKNINIRFSFNVMS